MKKQLQVVVLLALSLSIFSCGGKDDTNEIELSRTDVEANKQKMEDNMLEIFDVVEDFMTQDDSMSEIANFVSYIDRNDFELEEVSSVDFALNAMVVTTEFIESDFSRIPTIDGIEDSDSSTLLDDFEENTGIHVWNESTGDFDFTWSDSGKIIISVTENGKNSILTISEFDTLLHDSEEEIPTSLKMELTVNGETHFTHNYIVSINNDKYLPNTVFNEIIIGKGDLVYKTEFSKSDDNKETSGFTTLQIGNTLVFGTELSTKGDFNSLNDGTQEDIEDNSIEDFLSLVNASVSMDKTKIQFIVTPKNGINGFDTEEEAIQYLNNNVKISLLFDEGIVATGRFIKGTEDLQEVEIVFEDGTTSTLDAYFGENFKDVLGSLGIAK